MFVEDQQGKVIFDMRYYSIYVADNILYIYPFKEAQPFAYVGGKFETPRKTKEIAKEIKAFLDESKEIGIPGVYQIPPQKEDHIKSKG